jgi:hypothetical protein
MNIKHLLIASLVFATIATAADRPAVSARQALDAGEKSLAERALSKKVYIDSVALDHTALKGGEQFWFVRWSESFPALTAGRREIGLKVMMDGSVVRLVK